jgi:hypothetical protein
LEVEDADKKTRKKSTKKRKKKEAATTAAAEEDSTSEVKFDDTDEAGAEISLNVDLPDNLLSETSKVIDILLVESDTIWMLELLGRTGCTVQLLQPFAAHFKLLVHELATNM